MTRRKGHLFPRQVSDIGAFIFVCVMIPVTYMYETGLVLRHLYYRDAYATYILHMVIIVNSYKPKTVEFDRRDVICTFYCHKLNFLCHVVS